MILCTGVADQYLVFRGWEAYLGRSMFWCITCDGYECQGARVVAVGHTNAAAVEALQLQRFTPRLTLLTNRDTCMIDTPHRACLRRARIPLIQDRIAAVDGADGQCTALHTAGGRRLPLDRLFCQPEMAPRVQLAHELGVSLDSQGYILVDREQQTNMPGVYAAGDVTRVHAHQITTAVHEGATAASTANTYLYPPALTAS